MQYINETLKNWLLGKSEIDKVCPAVPPAAKSPDKLLELYRKAQQGTGDISKISQELDKLGYEVKTIHVLRKKE
jgi:hypothetical protein